MKNSLYIMDVSALNDKEKFESCYYTMPLRRRLKIDGYRFMKDKLLSLGAGILLKNALSSNGISPDRLIFNENDKPLISDCNDFFFNLSHSGSIAACAVSDRTVGVDVEQEQHFDENFAKSIYLPDEIEYINSHYDDPDRYFTKLWTIKESVMKFIGSGLSIEPKRISVNMTPPVRAVCRDVDISQLHFTQYELSGYAAAVCSEYEIFTDSVNMVTV